MGDLGDGDLMDGRFDGLRAEAGELDAARPSAGRRRGDMTSHALWPAWPADGSLDEHVDDSEDVVGGLPRNWKEGGRVLDLALDD